MVQVADFLEAAKSATTLTPKTGVLVITGSIYLVGEALQWLRS
jgi:folylpolyglutamate synthase/dihydropteroate synthase